MADEDLASTEEAEALELAPEERTDEAPDPVASLAGEMGWVPKDQFRGEPEKWKPADQFIRDGREIQQTTARELRSLREQMDRFGNVTTTLVQDKVAERDAYWRSQVAQATEEGDTERVLKLAEQRQAPQYQQPGADPAVAQWVTKNEWFNSDPLAAARAQEVSDRLKHLPVTEQLAQVERAIRKEFPEHFPAPVKQPPAVQTGQARNPNPSNRARGFSDMPAASQQMAKDMVRRHPGLKVEDIAASYWADPANQRRA